MKKKNVFLLAVLMLIIFLSYNVWENILILDDFHPSENLLDVSIDDMPEETEDTSVVTKGYYIYINLDELKLYLYKDGVLLKTYPVSGGKPETPSPEGTWKVISKSDWGGSFGGSWMGLNVPWGQYGIHGTKYPWCVGKQNASHGCIRMHNKSAKELYDTIPHGTTVTIVQKNRPFKELKSGDVGSDVQKVQKALKKLGYFHDWPSGKFQDNLKKSVIKFQKDNNIKVTGKVNKSLYNLIMKKYEEKLGNG
ncbi:L,D-transpeptidase family protein [Acetivibrio straminisolvens]|nr:L,D-transpeptidase family protein [Acetivibrio straminisolvens]